MKSWLHKLFLTLFALLQCASPLVHAHIESVDLASNTTTSGSHSLAHLHLDGLPVVAAAYDLSATSVVFASHLENQSSPQVSMPQACVRNHYVFEQSILIIDVLPSSNRILLEQPDFLTHSCLFLPVIHHLPAWPQAPPSSFDPA